jgi:hypothetical protein
MRKIVFFAIVAALVVLSASIVYGRGTANAGGAKLNGPPSATPAQGTSVATVNPQSIAGQAWKVVSFTNDQGQICGGVRVPNDGGDGGQELACRDKATMFAQNPLIYFAETRALPGDGPRWANAWVWGWASPDVARLVLEYTDCSVEPLAIGTDRVFFSRVSSGAELRRVAPQNLIAYDAAGNVVAKEPTPVNAPVGQHGASLSGATAPARTTC